MKRRKTSKRIGIRRLNFVQSCIIYFIIYSLVSILVLQGSYYLSRKLNSELDSSVEDILKYKDYLISEEYDRIPMNTMVNCELIVLDEGDTPIYTTDRAAARSVQEINLELVNDYYSGNVYYLYEKDYDDQSGAMIIIRQGYNSETRESVITGYSVLDANGNILRGNLFSGRSSFKEEELRLLSGIFNQYHYVEKYAFVTSAGLSRTAVFLTKIGSVNQQSRDILNNMFRFLPVILVLVSILLFSRLFARRIRRSFEPLKHAIEEYRKGNRIPIEEKYMVKEFQEIAEQYDALISELEESRKKANKEYAERQRILGSISHDIKTPLTVIEGYTMAISSGMVDGEKQIQYLDTIANKCEEMKELANSLLEYTQMDHLNIKLDLEVVDGCELARRYLAEKLYELELHKFELDIDIPDEPIYVLLDWRRFRRVVNNLFTNALKYNPPGTTMLFHLYTDGDDACLAIADNGVGIDENLRDYIFNPLVSGNAARTTGSGTGIGLTITKNIVEMHGGTIVLSKEPEEGYKTEFLIRMKLLKDQD